jgi:hypothetical protein
MNTTNSGVIETAKDKSVAAIKGTEKIAETTVDAAGHLLGTAVKDTAKVGGKVETAATGLVGGAVKGTKEVAVGAEHATAAVAGGAVKAVGEVGTAVVDTIHKPAAKPAHTDKPATTASRN